MVNNDYQVRLADPAITDLADIDDYISNELKAPQAAENLLASIQSTLAKLSYSPYSYLKVRDDRLAARGYHWIGVKNYVAFFTINESQKAVYVERILYVRRDWKRIL